MTPAFIDRMRKPTAQADLILPNATEAALLLQKDPAPRRAGEAAQALADELLTLAPPARWSPASHWASTSAAQVPARTASSSKTATSTRSFGTGDLYGAVLIGSLIQGNALSAAADNAAEFVSLAIQKTPRRAGTPASASGSSRCCPASARSELAEEEAAMSENRP